MSSERLLNSWRAWAEADVSERGLHATKPVIEMLANASRVLRDADWCRTADGSEAVHHDRAERQDA